MKKIKKQPIKKVEKKLKKEIELLTKDFFDYIKQSSINELITNSKSPTTLFGLSMGGDVHSIKIQLMPSTPEEKEELFTSLGKRLATEVTDLIAFGFSSEAWMTIKSKEEVKGGITSPSNDPERKEVLVIHVLNCDSLTRSSSILINRISQEKVLGVNEDDDSVKEINAQGWMLSKEKNAPRSSILETVAFAYTNELIVEEVSK